MKTNYKFKKNDDGTYTFFKVDIFKLGYFRSFNYDEDWFNRVKFNHEHNRDKNQYLPALFVGHSGWVEKPASGFIDNLQLEDSVIFADLVNIPEEEFNQIQSKRYPNRSIEVFDERAELAGVALLGSSIPYHKMPQLFSGQKGTKLLYEVPNENDSEDKDSNVNDKNLLNKIKNLFSTKPKDSKTQNQQEELMPKKEASFAEQFKTEFGESVESYKAKQKATKELLFTNKKSSFAMSLKNQSFSPKIQEKATAVFAQLQGSPEEAFTAFSDLLESISTSAKNKSLIVNTEEETEHNKEGKKYKLETENEKFADAEMDEEIKKIAKARAIPYAEAFDIYLTEGV